MTLGLVCDSCDALNALNAQACVSCGASLGIVPAKKPGSVAGPVAQQERKCAGCGNMVASSFRFCPTCGKPMSEAAAGAEPGRKAAPKTMFFSAMQAPRPKLILIKGDGMDGVSYM